MRKLKPEDALLLLAVLAAVGVLAYLLGLMPTELAGSANVR